MGAPRFTAEPQDAPREPMLDGLGYLLEHFPKTSQTFVARELESVRAAAEYVPIVSVRTPGEQPPQDYPPGLLDDVHYLPRDPRRQEKQDGDRWRRLVDEYRKHPEQRRLHEGILAAEWFQRAGVRHVHCHFAGIAARAALWMKRLFGMPFSLTVHANDVFLPGAKPPLSFDDIMREADFVVAVSDFMAQMLRRRFPAQAGRIHRVYNGISLPARVERASLATPPKHELVSVGRYVEMKGFDVLIEACARLSELELSCTIIGFGPLEAELRRKIAGLGLERRVVLAGPRTLSQVFEALRGASLFVLPCVRGRDGAMDNLPTVFMEAMAMQLPIISTPIAGIPEMVVHGETGLLVPERDPLALARAIRELLAEPARAREMGVSGRRLVEQRFDRRLTTRSLVGLFDAALRRHAPPARHARAPRR